jgi:hypothetical protein
MPSYHYFYTIYQTNVESVCYRTVSQSSAFESVRLSVRFDDASLFEKEVHPKIYFEYSYFEDASRFLI